MTSFNRRFCLPQDGSPSEELKTAAKSLYQQQFGNDSQISTGLDSLEKAEYKKIRDRVAKTIVKEAAPSFSLKHIDGTPVSLESLKGPTVNIDFWATWCQPYIAPFFGREIVNMNTIAVVYAQAKQLL